MAIAPTTVPTSGGGVLRRRARMLDPGRASHRPAVLRAEESTIHPVDSGGPAVDSVDGGLRGGLVDWWTAVDSVVCAARSAGSPLGGLGRG